MSRAYVCLLVLLGLSAVACNAQLEDAISAHASGKYLDAIAIYRRALEREPGSIAARKGLAQALIDTGKYADAEELLRAAPSSAAAAVANLLGDALVLQGKDAEPAYRLARSGPDSLTARLNLGILAYNRGQKDEAFREFDRFIDSYNRRKLAADELIAVGTAVSYLGERDPQLFKDALRAYDEAIAADPGNVEARLRIGELFLAKYNSTEAQKSFQEVLARNPFHARALLAMARAREFDGSPEVLELTRQALEINPNLLDAHVLTARTLLAAEDYAGAIRSAEAALAAHPNSLPALSVLAAAQQLGGDGAAFERTRTRVLALNPRYAMLYTTLAEQSVQTRQYARAVDYARQAIVLDSTAWSAHGLLGINLLRLGKIEEGRAALERAFAGDPYNVWFKNTLDLLDTMARFTVVNGGRFQIALDAREADLLVPYVSSLAEEAYARLSQRYKTQLATPIRIELFRHHPDFSVRTVGLAGLGALGASFGNVLVMDAPSAREAGHFNWGATLWHELAHAFHLALSDSRVPRWLTEGLASLEERRARPGWGDDVAPGFVQAYQQGKLLPVSQMNRGFVRPEYPAQVAYSYYQASLVAELIERDHGFDAILRMLRGYRDGLNHEQVLRAVLKTEPAAFDRKFDEYLKQKLARHLAAVRAAGGGDERARGEYASQLLRGRTAVEARKYDEAIHDLQQAKQLFPDYAGPDSPYKLLAEVYKTTGDLKRAADELEQLTARNEIDYEANLELADLHEKLGNPAGAAAALDRALYIYPMQPTLHERLAVLYKILGDKQKVIRERRAVLALNPVDRADAFYHLALAYYEAGDHASARREVLRALEEAPGFEKAQELLLKVRS